MSGSLVTLGETMALVQPPTPGRLVHARSLELRVGGAESNVAIAASRLGHAATWIGRVGSDGLGELVLRELRGEGVDVRVTVDPEAPTGLMVKERLVPGASRVGYFRTASAGSRLAPEDVDVATVSAAAVLHVTGITVALSASAEEALHLAISTARAASVPVSFDVNYRATLWRGRDPRPAMRQLAESADIVFAGADEAELLGVRAAGDDLARALADEFGVEAVIKLGADGAVAWADGALHSRPARPIRAVDTVGAGDGFVGGYLTELSAGKPVEQRLATAVAVGAFACLVPGDWEGYPRRGELSLLEADDPVER